jgi:cell division protein FtsB
MSIYWKKLYGMFKVWRNNRKMKKKIIILILALLSSLIAFSLFFASKFSKLSELDLFDIEEDDF